jgi:hypothetical protein
VQLLTPLVWLEKLNVGHIRHMFVTIAKIINDKGTASVLMTWKLDPGHPFTTEGLSSYICLHYVSFWIHHYLKYVYAFFHPSKAVTELLASKHEFDAWAAKFNVTISAIHADNIVYTAKSFCDSRNYNRESNNYVAPCYA